MSIIAAEGAETELALQAYPNLELVRTRELAGALPSVETLRRARGELLIHLGPGEALLPSAVASLTMALAGPPVALAAYPGYRLLDERGQPVEEVVPEELDLLEMLRFQRCPRGPAPIFQREAALEAARAAESAERSHPLAFWLHLASRGRVRRLTAPLATRPASAGTAAPGGLSAARARLRDLQRLLEELELPVGSEAAATSAARSACVLAAAEIEPGLNVPWDRFFVVDRFAAGEAEGVADDLDAEIACLETRVANLEQQLARQRATIPSLEAAVAQRDARLLDRTAQGRTELGRLVRRLRGSGR